MKKKLTSQNITLLNSGLSNLTIHIAQEPTSECTYPVHCLAMHQQSGTLQWLFPAVAKKPEFLRFYTRKGLSEKIHATCLRLLFFFRLAAWACDTRTTIYVNATTKAYLKAIDDWTISIKTGYPEGDKLILWLRNDNDNLFIKFPVAPVTSGFSLELKQYHRLVSGRKPQPSWKGALSAITGKWKSKMQGIYCSPHFQFS